MIGRKNKTVIQGKQSFREKTTNDMILIGGPADSIHIVITMQMQIEDLPNNADK